MSAGTYRWRVELLERDRALAALTEAHAGAARGSGRAVLVSGEPGIGKTALVTRFTRDLGADARVLWGACDDLSIPRPLGPFFDLAGDVAPALASALAAGAAPHEIQSLLIAELGEPTVLVLEDLHWADDATLDVITVLGRRIAALPALLVLTFRGGEAPPGHPLHAALGAVAGTSAFVELAPLSASAVASLAGDDGRELHALTGGNPFYVTELLAAPPGAELPPSVGNAVLGRAARLDDPARRLVELVSVVPHRVSTGLLDAVMPEWAAAAEQPERRQLLEVGPGHVGFRHELARHAVRASVPSSRRRQLHAEILAVLLAGGGDPAEIVHHAEAAGDSDVGGRVRARRRTARGGPRLQPRGVLALRAGGRLRGPAAPAAAGRGRRGAGPGRLRRQPPRGSLRGHGASDRPAPGARRPARRRPLHAHPLALPLVRGRRGHGPPHRPRRGRDPRAPRRVRRAGPRLQQPLAARDAGRAPRGGDRLGRARARARHPARRRGDPRARADQRRQRQARSRSEPRAPSCSRRTRSPMRRAIATRRRGRCSTSATT